MLASQHHNWQAHPHWNNIKDISNIAKTFKQIFEGFDEHDKMGDAFFRR